MEVRNAIISGVDFFINDKGILDLYLYLDYGGSGQAFGGYALYLPKSYHHHSLKSLAGHFIYRCLQIAGVERWNDLEGRSIRVQQDDCQVYAIGHIIKDDWFCPKKDFESLKLEEGE